MVEASESDSKSTAANTEADCRLPEEEDTWDPSIVLHYTYLAVETKAVEDLVLSAIKAAIVATWTSQKTHKMKAMPPFGFRVSNRKSLIKLGLEREITDTEVWLVQFHSQLGQQSKKREYRLNLQLALHAQQELRDVYWLVQADDEISSTHFSVEADRRP